MAELGELIPDVASVVVGAPEFQVEREVRNAVRDFCRLTGAWREELPEVTPSAGVAEYDFSAPDGVRVQNVLWAYLGSDRLTLAQDHQLRSENLRRGNAEGRPFLYSLVRGNTNRFLVSPIPGGDLTDVFRFYGVLTPDRTATQIPDWLVEYFEDGFIAGAVSRLMRANASWASPDAASYYNQVFRQKVTEAKGDPVDGYGAVKSATMYPFA